MEKITKEVKRNGCLPNFGSIYPWNRKSEKNEVKAKEVTELSTVRNEDKSYEYGSSIASKNGSLRKKEVTDGKHDKEVVAEMFRDKEEDGGFREKSNDASKDSSSGDQQEVMAGEEEEMPYLAFDESLKVVEAKKDENKQALPKFGAWEAIETPSDVNLEDQSFKHCSTKRRGAWNDGFNKVKTFDLRGLIKSSGKGD